MTCRTELCFMQNHCALGSVKQVDLLEFIIELYIVNIILFGPQKYDVIYNRIRYLLSQKGGIRQVISHNYARIKDDSHDSSALEKTLPLHNVIIL